MYPPEPLPNPEVHKEFHDLLVSNRLPEMRRFLENPPEDFDINVPIKLGDQTSGLIYAIMNTLYDMADLLLEFDADPTIKDRHGQDALLMASYDGVHQIIPKLIAGGAEVTTCANNGDGVMSFADKYSRRTIDMLLNLGIDPDQPGHEGFTKLQKTAIHDDDKPAKQLLEAGADPLLNNERGVPAMHYAGTNNPNGKTDQLLVHYAGLPRLEAGKDYSFAELSEGEIGRRIVDNPYNWRHGLGDILQEKAVQGEGFSKDEWLKPHAELEDKSLADIALNARQGRALFSILAAQGEAVTGEDLFQVKHGYAPTTFGQKCADCGQLPLVFEPERLGEINPQVLNAAYEAMPEESRLGINLHGVITQAKRVQVATTRER